MKSKRRFKWLIILILKFEPKLVQSARRVVVGRLRQYLIFQREVYHILYGYSRVHKRILFSKLKELKKVMMNFQTDLIQFEVYLLCPSQLFQCKIKDNLSD